MGSGDRQGEIRREENVAMLKVSFFGPFYAGKSLKANIPKVTCDGDVAENSWNKEKIAESARPD